MEITREKKLNNKELELRLQATEQALALALKRIEELSGQKRQLKDFIGDTVYDDLFSFAVDGKVDGRRKHENFTALYRRVAVVAGLRESRDGNRSFSAVPMQELKCSEYDRFGKLFADICSLIYSYKNEKEEESDGEIRE